MTWILSTSAPFYRWGVEKSPPQVHTGNKWWRQDVTSNPSDSQAHILNAAFCCIRASTQRNGAKLANLTSMYVSGGFKIYSWCWIHCSLGEAQIIVPEYQFFLGFFFFFTPFFINWFFCSYFWYRLSGFLLIARSQPHIQSFSFCFSSTSWSIP